jgi:hypothetical protein
MSYYTHFNFSEHPDSVQIGNGAGQFLSDFKGDEFVSHYENLSEADKNHLTEIYITKSTQSGRYVRSKIVSIWKKESETFNENYVSLKRHTTQINEINENVN